MSEKKKKGPEAVVREIKRQTRRKFSSEEKILSLQKAIISSLVCSL
jgi:hypothetical protein